MFERYPELRQIVLNTKTGQAFRGVLWRRRWGYVVLRNAELIRTKGETTPMDGELVVESGNVDFIQVVG